MIFYSAMRLIIMITVCIMIIDTYISSHWEGGWEDVQAWYGGKLGNLTVGVHMGLSEVIIERRTENGLHDETPFAWIDKDDSLGFGVDDVLLKQYQEVLSMGYPEYLYVNLEFLVADKEGLLFGRSYRKAGWYCRIILKLALCLWLVAYLLSFMLVRMACLVYICAGILLLLSSVVWASLRNKYASFYIPYIGKNGQDIIFRTEYHRDFFFCTFAGLLVTMGGVALVVADRKNPALTHKIFGVDMLLVKPQEEDDLLDAEEEVEVQEIQEAEDEGELKVEEEEEEEEDEDEDEDEQEPEAEATKLLPSSSSEEESKGPPEGYCGWCGIMWC